MLKLVPFLISLLVLVAFASSDQRCPKKDVIRPCICSKACLSCAPVIQCSGIKGEDKLDQLFKKTGDYPFTNLQFVNISARYIPANQVEKKRVKRLSVINSTLTTVFERSPSATSPLEILYLYSVNLVRGIELMMLEDLYHLRQLFVVDTDIRKVTEDFGEHMPKGLQVLEFMDTRTRSFSENSLAALKNLRSLTVRKTRISTIERSALPSPFIGTYLDLSDNRLTILPDDFFTDMPDLQTVILSRNQFSTFPQSVFGNLPTRLRVIFLRGNPIKCDCKVSWITSKKMPYLEGKCEEPKALKDKPIRKLRDSDFIQC